MEAGVNLVERLKPYALGRQEEVTDFLSVSKALDY